MRSGVSKTAWLLAISGIFIAVAGVGIWAASFTIGTAENASEESGTLVECSKYGFSIVQASYDAEMGELYLTVRNTGSKQLTNLTVLVMFSDTSGERHWVVGPNPSLTSRLTIPVDTQYSKADIDETVIYPQPCPDDRRTVTVP